MRVHSLELQEKIINLGVVYLNFPFIPEFFQLIEKTWNEKSYIFK